MLRYSMGTVHVGLEYEGNDSAPLLVAFCDADWANNIADRRSISGYLLKMFGCTILQYGQSENSGLCHCHCQRWWHSAKRHAKRYMDRSSFGRTRLPDKGADSILRRQSICPQRYGRTKGSEKAAHIDVKHNFVKELMQ